MFGYVPEYVFVFRFLNDGVCDLYIDALLMGGPMWSALSGHCLSCTGCWLYSLNMKWLVDGTLFLHTSISLPRIFLFTDSLFENRDCIVTSDLPNERFTYYTKNKDKEQRCSRLNNWHSLRCLGPWVNHLPPVWWSTFWFSLLIVGWCESLIWWRGIFLLIFLPLSMFIHHPSFAYFFSQINLLSHSFLYTLYWHFP